MKKYLFTAFLMLCSLVSFAQQANEAEIKFDKTSHDFGIFTESNSKVT